MSKDKKEEPSSLLTDTADRIVELFEEEQFSYHDLLAELMRFRQKLQKKRRKD